MAAIERDLPGGPPRYSLWSTEQVAPHERFTYYREAICKAFMDLTPELSPTTSFEAKVESIRFGTAALNRVRFPGHTIHRHATDIAASKRSCYYLNLNSADAARFTKLAEISFSLPGKSGFSRASGCSRSNTIRHRRSTLHPSGCLATPSSGACRPPSISGPPDCPITP